jgi:RimJ/RimL family protein N-acetyltransferase
MPVDVSTRSNRDERSFPGKVETFVFCQKLKDRGKMSLPLKSPRVYSVFETRDGRSVTLRPLRRGDIDALLLFANDIAREKKSNRSLGVVSMDRRMKRQDERRFLNRTLKGLAEGNVVSVSAFDRDRMVGNCDIFRRTLQDVRHTGVLGIVIVEGYRGVGLGEAMVRTALSQASKTGAWAIELEVFATNAPAKHLYEKVGFITAGVFPKKMQRDGKFIDSIQMYLHLPHK